MENPPPSAAPLPEGERSPAVTPRAERDAAGSVREDERPAPGARPGGTQEAALTEGQPVDVLVVEDDPRNLAAMRALLAGSGARILEARTAEEALRILLARQVALILLDVGLPGMSGLELARLVREREQTRLTPIIFLTASAEERLLESGYALGAIDFLTTPVPEQALRAKVAFFIEAHRKNEALRRSAELLRAAQDRELAANVAEARRRWEEEALRRERDHDRRLLESLHRANERLKILSGVRSELLSAVSVRERLPAICGRVAGHLGLERFALHLAGPGGRLSLVAAGGVSPAQAARVAALDIPEAILGGLEPRVSARGEPGPPIADALGVACCAARACFAGGKVVATLAFGSAARDAVDVDDPATLELVGYAIAMALDRDRLIAELQGRNDELREADRRKDQFLAMLAHELRNPLAPVSNAVRILQDYGADPRVRERALAAAGRQVRHMARLVDDLLDVSRIRSGKVRLRREAVDLARVVREAVQGVEELVASRRHTLHVNVVEGVVVLGDAVRLTQVVENLLTNAAKYTDPGGHLRIDLRREGSFAVLAVQDDGIGVPPELLSGIFELFVQAEQGVDRSRGGLGIGLSLVKNLVDMHGGDVRAASAGPGQGSTFTVRLPVAEGAVPAAAPAASAERREAPRRDILLIEDNADIRETLAELLRRRGHAVREAESGQAGIELARAAPPEIALVDIGLPELDGFEVAERLRELAPGARLVALTGYGGAEDRRRGSEAGFRAHLVKPVDIDELSALLDTLD